MHKRLLALAATMLGLLVFTGTAGAAQLGITAPPSGSSSSTGCSGVLIGQNTDSSTTPYLVPAGGGYITQWQTYSAGDAPGSTITLAVLRRASSTTYTVVGADTETIPNPLPSGNVASFTLPSPLQVAAGDTVGLYSSSGVVCYFYGGSTPTGDTLFAAPGGGLPTTGQTVTTSGSVSPAGYAMNVAFTLLTNQDVSVQTSTFPSTTDISSSALLQSVVTNGGPLATPITFTDQVPAGLRIQSATTGLGTCTVSGQTVTCTITGLPVGQSTMVNVLVSTPTAGTYANSVSVSVASPVIDANAANNSATTNLIVTKLPQKCIVPGLRKLPAASGRGLLTQLGCRVRVRNVHSSIAKGLVIGTAQKVGTYAYHQLVTLNVSSGPKAKKPKKH